MKTSMSTETREDEDQAREKKISNPARELYQEIVNRIRKLLNMDRHANEEEELQELQKERQKRLEHLKVLNKPYFDKIQRTITEIGQKIQRARADIDRAPPHEKQAKQKALKEEIANQGGFAWQLGDQEPVDLPWDLKGIGRTEAGEFVAEEKVKHHEILQMSPGQVGLPEGNEADLASNKELRAQVEADTALFMSWGFKAEDARRWAEDKARHPAGYYGFSAAEVAILKSTGPEGKEARENMFDDIFAVVDSQSSVSFHEALNQSTMYKLSQFFEILKELPGAKRLNDEYNSKQKLRMMLHNSAYLVEHGGGKPEQFQQMMEQFTPELFDQLFKYEEVDTAVHLYEIGVETFRSRNDNFLPWEQMVYNPKGGVDKSGLNEIDTWVMQRFEDIVRKKHTPPLSQEEFTKQWPEKKIMKTLALARGFEITTVRFPEMSARSRLPKGSDVMASPPYEDFARPLDSFEHFTEKFLTRDPGAAWMMFTITDGEILPDATRQDIDDYFNRKGIDPQHLHMMDVVNFLEIGGPFTQTSWRSLISMRDLDPQEKEWMGLSFGKYLIEEEYGMGFGVDVNNILDEALAEKAALFGVERSSGEDKKHFYARVKKAGGALEKIKIKELFAKTLKRNPVRILREAELMDGEILDLDVQAMVLEQTLQEVYGGGAEAKIAEFAARRLEGETNEHFSKRIATANKTTARKKFIDDSENALIVLTQLEVAKREGAINFDYADDDKRQQAEAYYRAICTAVETRQRKWLKENKVVKEKEGVRAWLFGDQFGEISPKQEEKETSIMDYLCQKKYPFTPGFDDTPFDRPDFIKMGQKGFSRRIRDYMGAQKAMMAMLDIQNHVGQLRKGEQVVGALDKVWQGIREYDKNKAKEKMTKLYEGMCKFNAANKPRRFLPFPLDVVNEFISNSGWFGAKPTSHARDQFGYAANSWRGVDMYNLLGMARTAGHITKAQEMELRKKLRCDVGNLISEYVCRGWLVGVVFIVGLWVQEALKQIQEQAKES